MKMVPTLLVPGRQTSCCSTGPPTTHATQQVIVARAGSNASHSHYRQQESREQQRRQQLGMHRRQQAQWDTHVQQQQQQEQPQQQQQKQQEQSCNHQAWPEQQILNTGRLNQDIMGCQSLADVHSIAMHHQRWLHEVGSPEQSMDAVNVSALATVSAKLWSSSPLSKPDHNQHHLPPPQHHQHQHTQLEYTKQLQGEGRPHLQHAQRAQHGPSAGSSTALYASDPHLLVAQLLHALCDLVAASSLTFRPRQFASAAWALSKLVTYESASGEASPVVPAAREARSVWRQSGGSVDEGPGAYMEQQQLGHPSASLNPAMPAFPSPFPALVPSVMHLIQQLTHEMCSRQTPDRALPLRDVAQVLYAHARVMKQPSTQEAHLMLVSVQRNACSMGPQDCAMLCYALGRLRLRPHPRQLRRLLTCSVPLLCKLTPQGLSNTAWGLAVLDAEPLPPQWSAAFLEASSTNMAAFSNQELALLVWALPRLRIVPSHTWMLALEGQVASRLHSLGPQDVSNLMWGMAQLKHRPDPLLVIEVAQEVAHRITPSWAATATMHCSPTATSSCATTATSSSTPTATTSTTDTSSCAPTATTSTTDTSSSASTATTSNTDTSSCSPPAITSTTDTSSCSPPAITGDTDTTAPSSHAVAAPTPVHGLQASAVQEAGASTSSAPILAHGQQHASFGAEDDGFTAGSNASALAHSLRASASQPEDHGHENLKGISAACAVNKEHGAPGVEHGLFRRDGSQGSPASLEWTEGATTDAATSSSLSSAAASAVREDLAASGVKHKLSRDEGQGAPADTEWTVSAATDAAAGPSSSSAAASTAHEEQIESGEVVGHFRHGGDQQAPAEMEWARVTAPGAAPRSSPGPSTAAAAAAGGAEVAAGTAPSWSVDPFAHGSLHILQPTAKVPPPQQAAPRTLDPSFSSSLSLSPSTNSHYSATTPSLKPPPPRPGIPPSTDPAAWPKRSRAQTISQPRGARIPKAAPAHVPISHPLYSSVSGPQGVATQSIPWPVRSAAQRTTFPHPTPALGTVQSSGRMPSGEQSASLTRPTSSAFRGAFQGPAAPELWEDPSARDLPRPTLSALGGLSHGPVAPQLSWGSSMDLPRPTSSAFQGMLQGPTAPTAWGLPSTPPLTPSSGGLPLKAKQVHSALLQGSPTQRAEPLPGAGLDSLGSDRPALPDSPPSSAGWGPATRPQVLITLLGSCAVFRIMPPSGVLESFARSLGARLHTCNANDLSSAFAALACLRFLPDERWMLRFFAASRMRMPQFSAPQLVALLHGLAGLRVRPDHAWMEWALAEVGQKLSGCQPSHFARLAWALSTLGYRPSAPWLESFCGASQLTLGHSSAHELWMLSCGLAKLGVKARTNSSSGSCSSDISCSQSPARLITSNALFQGLKHPNSSQTPPAETRQGSLFPGPVANTVCASGTDSFPVSDDACDNSPEHQASCSVSVFKGRHHPGRPAAPRSHTRLQQQQQLLQKQQHQQQQEQQQQLQLLQRMHRRRAAHVHTQKQQVNPSAEGSSAGWEDELQVMSDGQLPPSWVLSLQQAVVSHIHDFEPHRLHAVLVALVRLRGAQAPRQHSPPHRRRRRHLQGEQQQQEQQQKHDKLREQGMGALSSAFPSSRPSSGEPRLRQHELHPLFSRASQRPQSAADGLGSVRSPSTVRKEQVAAPSQGVSDGARMGNGSQQQHHEGQQLSKDLCLSEREEQQLSERQQRGERQQLNERLQRNELKERKDAWDAALIDAYSTASLMLLAPPLLVRKRETALKHRGKQTIVARGRC